MPDDLRKRLWDLVEHATHDKHMHEEEARSKASKACMILKDHWEELIGAGPGSGKAVVAMETIDARRSKLGTRLTELGVQTGSMLARGRPCATCGIPIRNADEAFRYHSLRNIEGVVTHVKEPCCFKWLSFDEKTGRFRDNT